MVAVGFRTQRPVIRHPSTFPLSCSTIPRHKLQHTPCPNRLQTIPCPSAKRGIRVPLEPLKMPGLRATTGKAEEEEEEEEMEEEAENVTGCHGLTAFRLGSEPRGLRRLTVTTATLQRQSHRTS